MTMNEKMLVTQALDERDLLVKKINDKINKASFVDTIKKNENLVYQHRITEEEYKKEVESHFQQINDLIEYHKKLDAAIVASNASHYIQTSYGKMTVAAGISLRNRLRAFNGYGVDTDFETTLFMRMEKEYSKQLEFMEMKNKQLQTTAEEMRLSILGKDSKTKDEKPLEVVETYVKENTVELVDPLSILKKIEILKEKKETLLRELDTQIKVSNATTFIEL